MSKIWLTLILASLAFVPLVLVAVGPSLVRFAGHVVGWYLRRKTAGRRAQIVERVEEEEKALKVQMEGRRDSEEEWENVESYAAGSIGNGEKAEKEWDGVVGFFHPFWYFPRTLFAVFLVGLLICA